MHLDAEEIRDFYRKNRLGIYAGQLLAEKTAEIWDSLRGLTVVGYGFAPPVLQYAVGNAAGLVNLMPARHGVVRWPDGKSNTSVLTHETDWPLPTGYADRIVMLHGLETGANPGGLLDECWRVLAPEGKVLIIVPNRAGLWAKGDATPFGFGRPFTSGQLQNFLGKRRFGVLNIRAALFAPPSGRGFWLAGASVIEKLGSNARLRFAGGVLLLEAQKRVFQMHRPPLTEAVASGLRALEGITAPGAKPVSGRDAA